jgi:hypothetical protein
MFLGFGLNHFLGWIPLPLESLPPRARQFFDLLDQSGYLLVIRILEILGGAALLHPRTIPFGLILLIPIMLNIWLFEVLLIGQLRIATFMILSAAMLAVYHKHCLAGCLPWAPSTPTRPAGPEPLRHENGMR